MTRTAAREIAVRAGFAMFESELRPEPVIEEMFDKEYYATLAEEDEVFSSYPDEKQLEYIFALIKGMWNHGAELDAYVEKYSQGWKFDRISRTAVAIMKTAMYEMLYMPEIPDSAAINEAVELAKKYEEQETVGFINGVLGAFARSEAIY